MTESDYANEGAQKEHDAGVLEGASAERTRLLAIAQKVVDVAWENAELPGGHERWRGAADVLRALQEAK